MKSPLFILLFIFLLSATSFAQRNKDTIVGTIKVKKKEIKADTLATTDCECPICNADQKPSFPGGEKALLKYFAKAIIDEHCQFVKKEKNKHATIYIKFTVDEEGQMNNIKIVPSFKKGKRIKASKNIPVFCGDAVLDAVRKMPKWNPAMTDGKAVACEKSLSINVALKR